MVRAGLAYSFPYYLSSLMLIQYMFVTEYYHQPFFFLWQYFGLLPIMDQIVPWDTTNPTPEEAKILKKQWKWQIPVYLFVVIDWVSLFWAFSYVHRYQPSTLNFIILTLSMGLTSAFGFLFSHELMHKKGFIDQFIGASNMLKNLYMHFYSEHLYGHHKNVSTPGDPASAKFGQTLYEFFYQSIVGGFVDTWDREGAYAEKKGQPFFSIYNKMIVWVLVELGFTFVVWKMFGDRCLVLFLCHAAVSVLLLETVNYIRHYGLVRKLLPNGEYEPVTTKHSWNAPQRIQNYALLKLQRHSDHHANAYKSYHILESPKDAPNFPGGYAVCVLACFFPWIWFKIANPLAEATNKFEKPNSEQMKRSTSALNIWLAIQVLTINMISGCLYAYS